MKRPEKVSRRLDYLFFFLSLCIFFAVTSIIGLSIVNLVRSMSRDIPIWVPRTEYLDYSMLIAGCGAIAYGLLEFLKRLGTKLWPKSDKQPKAPEGGEV